MKLTEHAQQYLELFAENLHYFEAYKQAERGKYDSALNHIDFIENPDWEFARDMCEFGIRNRINIEFKKYAGARRAGEVDKACELMCEIQSQNGLLLNMNSEYALDTNTLSAQVRYLCDQQANKYYSQAEKALIEGNIPVAQALLQVSDAFYKEAYSE